MIRQLNDPKARMRQAGAGRSCMDGEGGRRIVKEILKKIYAANRPVKLRKATKGDVRDIWLWRNSREIRRWCFFR